MRDAEYMAAPSRRLDGIGGTDKRGTTSRRRLNNSPGGRVARWREAADAVWFGPAGTTMRQAVSEAARAILPARCVGCTSDAGPLCPECSSHLGKALLRPAVVDDLREFDVLAPSSPAPVVCSAPYSGIVSNVLLAAKTRGGLGLIERFGPAVERTWNLLQSVAGPVVVVPIPSKASSVRSRGFSPVEELLRASHVRPVMNLLRVRTLTSLGLANQGPQKSRGRSGRANAVKGQFAVDYRAVAHVKHRSPYRKVPRHVVLFDDVVTTGATLAEASRVLRAHGFNVKGAFCVAWVRPPGGANVVSEISHPLN